MSQSSLLYKVYDDENIKSSVLNVYVYFHALRNTNI